MPFSRYWMPNRLQPMCFTSRLFCPRMDFMIRRTSIGLSLPSSLRYISCALFGRFTASPSWMKSHISTLSSSGSAAYFTLKA